jgi:ribosomal RNA-processing protein 12
MYIDEAQDEEGEEEEDVAGNAYRENLTSVDGFTRGRNGRVKFNKDTKKRRRDGELDEDVEMEDGTGPKPKKSPKKAAPPKFGHSFKAKVRKGKRDAFLY